MRIWGAGAVFSSIGWVESFVFIVYDLQAQYTLREIKMEIVIAVAGVYSCNHENSNLISPFEFRWVSWWSQEQTPATANRPKGLFSLFSPFGHFSPLALFPYLCPTNHE